MPKNFVDFGEIDLREGRERARIAVAYNGSLQVIDRFNSALARFGNIIERIDSRVDKLEARGHAIDSFFDISIEEVENMDIGSRVEMEKLKARYVSLLEFGIGNGDLQKIAKETGAIAKELKQELTDPRAKLGEIVNEIKRVVETGPPTDRKKKK